MYQSFLFIHSWLRWIILILMLIVIVKSIIGFIRSSSYEKSDNILSASTVGFIYLQFIIGLVLYIFLSPLTEAAFADFGGAMKNATQRYWAVEHILAMVMAVALAQIGRSKAKKSTESSSKFKLQLIFFGLSLIVMLSRIPFSEAERLFR